MATGNKNNHWRLDVVKEERVTEDLHVRRRSMVKEGWLKRKERGKIVVGGIGIL